MTDQLANDGLDDDATTPEAATAARPSADPQTEPTEPTESDGGSPRRGQRISKWDRPPEPHDWRFFVGTLGKVLIATGLLMFGFVAYQLWGTGIETARAQSSLKNEFEELIEQRRTGTTQPDLEPADDAGSANTEAPDDGVFADVAEQPADAAPLDDPADPDDAGATGDTGDTADAGADPPVDQPLVAIEQDIPPILRGDPLALLEIPAIGRSDIVVPGVSLDDLKDGPGHYPETPLPGQLGNAAVAGHRTTYGAPFFDVDDLVPGDELIVTMLTGDRFVYEVTGTEIVSASDYWVVTTRDPTVAELTLTSCHPKYTARDRIVVRSVLNPAKSSNVGVRTGPYSLDTDDQPIPGDDPVLVDEQPADEDPSEIDPSGDADVEPSTGGPSDDTASSEQPAPSGASQDDDTDNDVAAAAPDEPPDEVGNEVGDAFSQGWFDDRAAFAQIALWGLALTVISIGSYRISRRFRHDSIGFLVGIVPFLFCLYFFYQNVNRLLPPGL